MQSCGEVLEQERQRLLDGRGRNDVIIIQHQDDRLFNPPKSLISSVRIVSAGGGCGACSRRAAVSPMVGSAVRRAAMRYARKRDRSLSFSSSDNQADLTAVSLASQADTSVVLPNPAGAETSVNRAAKVPADWLRPPLSRSMRWVRLMSDGRSAGLNSLVCKSRLDTRPL